MLRREPFFSGYALFCIHDLQGECPLTNIYKCKKRGGFVEEICEDATCEWRLKKEGFLNCTWVACNYGPFTLEEVGEMMGVTRERIRQIEAKALKKLQHKKRRDQLRDFASPDNDWDVI
jgi:hypothetical protein